MPVCSRSLRLALDRTLTVFSEFSPPTFTTSSTAADRVNLKESPMPRTIHVVAAIAVLLGTARGASAQRVVLKSAETPKAEVGIYAGLWNLEATGQSGTGGRVTVNRSEWFGTEASVERKGDEVSGATQTALILNARAIRTDHEHRAIAIFTAGVAIGNGAHRTVSPMLGIGMQTPWVGGFGAVRGELQYFRFGLNQTSHKTRVICAFVLAIR